MTFFQMKITTAKTLEMQAYESFIRRAAKIDAPFMLKGSYVTRQYFSDPGIRIPADLDWVYQKKISEVATAGVLFSEWVTTITEMNLDDEVRFRSFSVNDFWRSLDYAMADDFPTVNTDLKCWVAGIELNLALDISFNLVLEHSAVSLEYKPLTGVPFTITNTVPLSLQVSWKIHQTLVRPRFKDLFDLIQLVRHPTFTSNTLNLSFEALLQECAADQVDLIRLRYLLEFDMAKLFPNNCITESWNSWRHNVNNKNYSGDIQYFEKAEEVTDVMLLPEELDDFLEQFKETLQKSGFTIALLEKVSLFQPNTKPEEDFQEVAPSTRSILQKIKGFFGQ